MKRFAQLPFHFNKEFLNKDLSSIQQEYWKEIPTAYANIGAVWGIDLFEIDLEKTIPGERVAFKKSALLNNCNYLNEVLDTFSSCEILKARLNLLKSGERIQPHRDGYGFGNGQVRIHIPIRTNEGFRFTIEDESKFFSEGECWYVNTRLIHHVENKGTEDRIHLVIDCLVNDWLEEIFISQGFSPLNEVLNQNLTL